MAISPKPPVVTIMGHVDHGKTTLLDYIRKSRIAAKEAGGITQHIGAYQTTYQDKSITFIDTPGHAAFAQMRAHGANITDLVILVVAADDGIKPQTKEAIKLIKDGNIPCIVAINKIDLQTAVPEMVKAQLVEEGIFVEGYGGNTPVIPISARAGTNVDKLLETILLLAEVEELTADAEGPVEAVVIEASMKKNQGPVTSLLVVEGTLRVNSELVSVIDDGKYSAKVKRMTNDLNKSLTEATPGTPVQVLGFREVPVVGSVFTLPATRELVKENIKTKRNLSRVRQVVDQTEESIQEKAQVNIRLIILADTQGTLDSIMQNLPMQLEIIRSGTGEITESDILLADSTNSFIIGFNVSITPGAKKLADIEKVRIKTYNVIYELLEDFEKQVLKLLEPTIDEEELGTAKVKALFNMKGDVIAGCVITQGSVSLNDSVHLKRNNKIIADARVVSLKQGKIDVKKMEVNQECGIVLKPVLKLEVDDYLYTFRKLA